MTTESMVGEPCCDTTVMTRTVNLIESYTSGFKRLFFTYKFLSHRLIGLTYLIQYVIALYLYPFDYDKFLVSNIIWTLPLTALCQSINASLTFTFLPKKKHPGFAAVSDKSVLSYYTVVENSFYSLQLLFAYCYLSDYIRPYIQKSIIIEPIFVFFIFYFRDLWPSSRISASLANSTKNKSDSNRWILIVSTYSIKIFYLFAKHFIGTFPLYLQFLNRITKEDQRLLYGVEMLSAYASTISIFIHTLKFKRYIGSITAMIAYDIIIPGFIYLYYGMFKILMKNMDVVMITGVGMVLNLVPKIYGNIRPWFIWQAIVAYMFYGQVEIAKITEIIDIRYYLIFMFVTTACLFRK